MGLANTRLLFGFLDENCSKMQEIHKKHTTAKISRDINYDQKMKKARIIEKTEKYTGKTVTFSKKNLKKLENSKNIERKVKITSELAGYMKKGSILCIFGFFKAICGFLKAIFGFLAMHVFGCSAFLVFI